MGTVREASAGIGAARRNDALARGGTNLVLTARSRGVLEKPGAEVEAAQIKSKQKIVADLAAKPTLLKQFSN